MALGWTYTVVTVSTIIIIIIKSDLFEPLICLLVEVDLAGGREILGGLTKVAEKSLGAASPLVGSRVVRVELDGSRTVLGGGKVRSRGTLWWSLWLTFTQALVAWGEILR